MVVVTALNVGEIQYDIGYDEALSNALKELQLPESQTLEKLRIRRRRNKAKNKNKKSSMVDRRGSKECDELSITDKTLCGYLMSFEIPVEKFKDPVKLMKYEPLNGSSYIPLPKVLANTKALINIKNKDDECLRWAFLFRFVSTTPYTQFFQCLTFWKLKCF